GVGTCSLRAPIWRGLLESAARREVALEVRPRVVREGEHGLDELAQAALLRCDLAACRELRSSLVDSLGLHVGPPSRLDGLPSSRPASKSPTGQRESADDRAAWRQLRRRVARPRAWFPERERGSSRT